MIRTHRSSIPSCFQPSTRWTTQKGETSPNTGGLKNASTHRYDECYTNFSFHFTIRRIKPASRREPSIKVSEFHLAQANKAKGKVSVDVRQLADAIKSPQTLALRRKLGVMKTKQTTLAKPLEKVVADKVCIKQKTEEHFFSLGRN
jgi:hypothetical protein